MVENIFKNKIILVTGGTGSIGSKIVERLLGLEPRQIRVLSRDESKQYDLIEKYGHPNSLRMFIGDIRDRERLDLAFKGVDIVFHAAALKHVPFCEYNPFEAVKTNIVGSQNVIEAALRHNVWRVIGISTDKAANPVNILGTSKLMMEKLFINANNYVGSASTRFSCVRFGNVAWARGSVFPLWQNQVKKHKNIDVTDGEMTRFLMSTADACELVLEATKLAKGGEVFILKMPSIKLSDLAELFINKYHPRENIKIKIIGLRPGEKKHEDLLDANLENAEIHEGKKMFIIVPQMEIYGWKGKKAVYAGFKKISKQEKYSSEDWINREKIKDII